MLWIIKKVKDFWSWISFFGHIVGWLGLASVFSGVMVAAIGIVGAIIKGLPWPFVLMAGYCTLVGVVYLAMAPIAFQILIAVSRTNQPRFIRPNYEAWKHVEKFTLSEASQLWNELEPDVPGNYTSEVKAWIKAFCAAIRKGELGFIATGNFNEMGEKANPDGNTQVSRRDLTDFAIRNNYKRNFLDQ
jgi:hypothetical protein